MKHEDQLIELLVQTLKVQDRQAHQLHQLSTTVVELKKALHQSHSEENILLAKTKEISHLKKRISFLEKRRRQGR